tara:strand:- start:12 stop:488 length:477 start_codon:yes stop_codon:yes gene_type:complete
MDKMNTIEFLSYIGQPLTKEEMTLLYKANNVRYDKCELYYDFIKTLNLLVIDTYLGDDVVITEEDQKRHYLWCFNKVVVDFKSENIIFEDTDGLKLYFFNFYNELFYLVDDKEDIMAKLNMLANLSFDFHRIKTRSDMDLLIVLYKLFEKSLNYKLKT